jgi:hypothetical protein
MIEHFMAVLLPPIFFVLGWGILYELFYKGAFFDNNYGVFGGIITLEIALMLIYFPCHGAYYVFTKGLFGILIKDFIVVLTGIVSASVFIWVVLRTIHKFVKNFQLS